MDRLPPEILEKAAAFACVDGGAAGCALAGVSRAMRRASARVRYHSVALRGPRQIRAFIELVRWSRAPRAPQKFWRRERALSKPDVRVCHLFLADCAMRPNDPDAALAWTEWQPHAGLRGSIGTALVKVQAESFWAEVIGGGAARARSAALAEAAVSALLAHLAPALTHLHLSTWLPFSWAPLPPAVFPALRELTSSMQKVDWQGPPVDLAHVAPALRRMHIVGDFAYNHYTLFRASGFARALVNLRLSECWHTGLLLQCLNELAWPAHCSPEHIERIVIAPHAPGATMAAILRTRDPRGRAGDHGRHAGSLFRYMLIGAFTLVRSNEPDEPWEYGQWREVASKRYDLVPKVSLIREVALWTEERLCDDWLDAVQGRSLVWEEGVPLAVGE